MAQLINEAKRMQLLAGLITESQLDEVDSSLLGGIAKNMYLDIKKLPVNQPLNKEGKPMMNVKGEPIKYTDKVKMYYQNASLAKKGAAKDINRAGGDEVTLWYTVDYINALGFIKKEEAEKVLQNILSKYPKEVTGEVKVNPGERGWGDTYTVTIRLNKQDQRSKYNVNTYSYSRAQNSNDRKRAEKAAQPQQESIEKAVNEALRKVRISEAEDKTKPAKPAVQQTSGTQQYASSLNQAASVKQRAQNVKLADLPSSFEAWFNTLGLKNQPNISKSSIINAIQTALTKMGVK